MYLKGPKSMYFIIPVTIFQIKIALRVNYRGSPHKKPPKINVLRGFESF